MDAPELIAKLFRYMVKPFRDYRFVGTRSLVPVVFCMIVVASLFTGPEGGRFEERSKSMLYVACVITGIVAGVVVYRYKK